MYAWVTIGHEKPYRSVVLASGEYEGNWSGFEQLLHEYYVVLNREKTKLIKVDTFDHLDGIPEVHVTPIDKNKEHWAYDIVDFLSKDYRPETLADEKLSPELLQKCIELDRKYDENYHEIVQLKDQQDFYNLMGSNDSFGEAYVLKVEKETDDKIHVFFDESWGSKIDMWFEGNPAYFLDKYRNEKGWDGASIFFEDGYIYLVDGYGVKTARSDKFRTFFRGKKVFYRVKPSLVSFKRTSWISH